MKVYIENTSEGFDRIIERDSVEAAFEEHKRDYFTQEQTVLTITLVRKYFGFTGYVSDWKICSIIDWDKLEFDSDSEMEFEIRYWLSKDEKTAYADITDLKTGEILDDMSFPYPGDLPDICTDR